MYFTSRSMFVAMLLAAGALFCFGFMFGTMV